MQQSTKKQITILITGAGGSIGSEISAQVSEGFNNALILLNDISESALFAVYEKLSTRGGNNKLIPILGDVNQKYVQDIIGKFRNIDHIYHAAAYKHVNMSEENPIAYFMNNVGSTANLIKLARSTGAQITFISSDKAVNPINVMGRTKRLCEFLIIHDNTQHNRGHKIVRFGNVLNSSGSVLPIFRNQILKGGPVTVTDVNATRFFMTIQEAVTLVLEAKNTSENEMILVLNMGDPISIDKLARNMIEENGLRVVAKKNNSDEIELLYIGLRKGEKLHEQLSYNRTEETKIKNILVSKENLEVSSLTMSKINKALESEENPDWNSFKWI